MYTSDVYLSKWLEACRLRRVANIMPKKIINYLDI